MKITTANTFSFKLAWSTYDQGDLARVKITHWAGETAKNMRYATKTETIKLPINDTLSYIQRVEREGKGEMTAELMNKEGVKYTQECLNTLQKMELCDWYTRRPKIY